MNQQEIDAAVRRVRDCQHNRWHYADQHGNRRCCQCDAFIREVPGAVIFREERRTLTDGWVQPGWRMHREIENRARADIGLPLLTKQPEIREQSRWVTEWADL